MSTRRAACMDSLSKPPMRISVLIPAHNSASVIDRAIVSALGQTMPPDEVIVVDDGSNDDTRARLSRYGDRVK